MCRACIQGGANMLSHPTPPPELAAAVVENAWSYNREAEGTASEIAKGVYKTARTPTARTLEK